MSEAKSLLHVRGGVSTAGLSVSCVCRSSPRPWRCFFERLTRDVSQAVFSTSVEVFRLRAVSSASVRSLLHVRGGVSSDQHQ